MKRRKIFLLLLILLLISACSSTEPQATVEPTDAPPLALTTIVEPTASLQNNLPRDEAAVPRVSIQQALAALNSGAAVIVDVRSKEAYDQEHIAGAISIPLATIESDPTSLNLKKDQWIITYCT
jgi:uncharacterized protein YcfL